MPYLLRVHFASIGHRDARLAPLTIDLRDAHNGRAVDSLIWLRNGGGKSSVLNLLYSIFRPDRREFLGSSAEGKARKLEHYVKAKDMAFVITEWEEPEATGLFERRTRIVGQCLSWQGQQRSDDPSKLRRLFFSLRTDSALRLDTLPIQGLGPNPVGSWERFRDWLEETAREQPQADVVWEENQRAWLTHLDALGLDPELFRYQVRMNLREGAADEQFRFGSAEEFVRFFLELAFDPVSASQVSVSLAALRDKLRRKPDVELEQRFLRAALGALTPLSRAVEELEEATRDHERARREAAATVAALRASGESLNLEAGAEGERAEQAETDRKALSNERDKRLRWSRGLERRARELEVEEIKGEVARSAAHLQELELQVRLLKAAARRHQRDALVSRREGLVAALQVEQREREPLRLEFAAAGAVLSAAIGARIRECGANEHRDQSAAVEIDVRIKDLDELILASARALGQNTEEQKTLRDRIGERDRRREALRGKGLFEDREEARDAVDRWRKAAHRADESLAGIGRRRKDLDEDLSRLAGDERQRYAEESRYEAEGKQLARDLAEAERWRDRLATQSRLRECEQSDVVSLEAAGLEARLRRVAEECQQKVLQLKVDGADDERAREGITATGLLPPSRNTVHLRNSLVAAGPRA